MIKNLVNRYGVYLIGAILCFALFGSLSNVEDEKRKTSSLEETICNLSQEVKRSEIKLNDSIRAYQTEVKNLTFAKANIQTKYDELLKATNVKPKDVKSVTEVPVMIHSIDTVIAYVDSFGGIKANFHDSFTKIDIEVFPDRNTIIEYEMKDSLTVINVQKKRSWLFGLIKWREPISTKVINRNPKTIITDLQVIDILE